MLVIVLAAIICATLLQGCVPREATLPDPKIPHRVARPATVQIWARRADGSLTEETVQLQPGWWIASPQVVDP